MRAARRATLTGACLVAACATGGRQPVTFAVADLASVAQQWDAKVVTVSGVMQSSHLGLFLDDPGLTTAARLRFDEPCRAPMGDARAVRDRRFRHAQQLGNSLGSPGGAYGRHCSAITIEGIVSAKFDRPFNPYLESPLEICVLRVLHVDSKAAPCVPVR